MVAPTRSTPAFHGVEGERALQLLMDFLHRDRVDAIQRPQIVVPSGTPALSTTFFGSSWTGSGVLAELRRLGMNPSDLLVTDVLPEFSGRPTATDYLGGTWLLGNKATKDAEATIDLMLYLVGPEHTLQIAERTSTPPARKSAEKAPFLQDPVFRPFYDMQTSGWSVPQHPRFELVRQKNQALLADALQQKRSVKETLSEMAAYATSELAPG